MSITFFQNSAIPKYRVSRKVNGVEYQFYFEYTDAGLRAARKKDAELLAMIKETHQPAGRPLTPGKHQHYIEQNRKKFKTGVIGVSLYTGRANEGPSFVSAWKNSRGRKVTLRRSIIKHGYFKAWHDVTAPMYKSLRLGEVPEAPEKSDAIDFCKASGVLPEYCEF